MVQFKGQSASATGTITPYTPSVLEFAVKRRMAIIESLSVSFIGIQSGSWNWDGPSGYGSGMAWSTTFHSRVVKSFAVGVRSTSAPTGTR